MTTRFGLAALVLASAISPLGLTAQTQLPGIRGSAESIVAARRLLQQVGGDSWRARVMEVNERGYSANGDAFELRITRDFESGRRLLERKSASGQFVEWVAPDRGWTEQDGKRQVMPEAERRAEHSGIKQEPYAIYHRLAIGDPELRVELRDRGTRLMVFDKEDRVLCWFRLDANATPIGWGNFYDGHINEHYYGPLASFGAINLPRWGVSSTGAFRFEYQRAQLSDRPLQEPNASAQGPVESVVYSMERDGNHDLYLARADGSHVRRLTTDPLADETPRCSPDGRYVAFVRGGLRGGDLVRLDLATGQEQRLTNDAASDFTPTWSPDGTRIYFTKRTGAFDRLAVMTADGRDVQFLTEGERWHDTMPAITPDGRTLVHHTYRYGQGTELQLLDLTTRASRRLTTAEGFDYEAFFAGPDDVLFSSDRDGGRYRIYVTSIVNGTTRLLADTGADAWNSRYSPRSGRVLFHSGSPGKWRLYTTTLAGGAVYPFLDDGTSKSGADWCVTQSAP